MELGIGLYGILAALIIMCPQESRGAFQDELQVQAFKYAETSPPVLDVSNHSIFESHHLITKVEFYYESGSQGTWTLDPDPLRFTFSIDDSPSNLIWIGREHPLNLTRTTPVEPFTALGSIWAQNQLEALAPRVSGWVGAGFVQNIGSDVKIIGAYSPLFLPTFGPSLGFSDRGDLNPSRYARLPPADAVSDGVRIPIRYKLQLGQLSDLLLQHQAFAGIAHDDPSFAFDVYAYTAPKPDPVPLTDAKLAVSPDDLNAKVYIDPQFPREYWSGLRFQLKALPVQPAFEFVQNLHEPNTHLVSATGYFDSPQINPYAVKRLTRGAFGALSHFGNDFSSPSLHDFLVFAKVPLTLTDWLEFRVLFEDTLMAFRRSFYLFSELEYVIKSGLSVTLTVRMLAGDDNSYFGDWRANDSSSIGVKWAF